MRTTVVGAESTVGTHRRNTYAFSPFDLEDVPCNGTLHGGEVMLIPAPATITLVIVHSALRAPPNSMLSMFNTSSPELCSIIVVAIVSPARQASGMQALTPSM